jgi:hypothetical protein
MLIKLLLFTIVSCYHNNPICFFTGFVSSSSRHSCQQFLWSFTEGHLWNRTANFIWSKVVERWTSKSNYMQLETKIVIMHTGGSRGGVQGIQTPPPPSLYVLCVIIYITKNVTWCHRSYVMSVSGPPLLNVPGSAFDADVLIISYRYIVCVFFYISAMADCHEAWICCCFVLLCWIWNIYWWYYIYICSQCYL